MRNTLILLILVSIGLTSPALAKNHNGERSGKSDQRRIERVEQDHRHYAKHDRRDGKYGHFQKRMKKLRKELRHQRRDNRRIERRDERRYKRIRKYYGHRQQHRTPVVVAPRRSVSQLFFPNIVVRIPLNW